MQFRLLAILLPALGLLISACSDVVEDTPPASRPVKIFVVEGPGGQALRNFPGSVRASKRADLSFRVPGVLQQMLVREGEDVIAGQMLAQLDPTDYKITLEDRQATFDNAKSNFNRAKELIVDGNISKLDYDRMEASFRTNRAALTQAKQDLEYTELKAPFTGTIGRREVENFEEVIAKQTIFRFQNIDQMDISVDLPESLVRSFAPTTADRQPGSETDKLVASTASFEGRPGLSFPLSIKEIATKADQQTQTFRVTLTMPQPAEFRILPGMTANVQVDFSKIISVDEAKWVPLSAVQADSKLDARVWLLDKETMTVKSHPVKIGRMRDRNIEVVEGLSGGEEIISVGAPYLSEGMHVTRMRQSEQAVPREDEA
ncbi:MAG: efflux RND transporter periplasmic adaptor subunit [Halieaceae bacterium]